MKINNIKKGPILITGGTGFLGSHLAEKLINANVQIFCSYRSINPHSYFYARNLHKKITTVELDVINFQELYNFVQKKEISYIFHLAAQPLVTVAYSNPLDTLYTNILGTINILECSRIISAIQGVVIASSDKAYGPPRKKQYAEKDQLNGKHPYDVSKLSADFISQTYYKTYNIPVSIIRCGNIYGEGDLHFSRIVPGVLKSIITNKEFEIRSNGNYIRDYIYVKDVVNALVLVMNNIQQTRSEIFNISTSETLSVLEVVEIIEKSLGTKVSYLIKNESVGEIIKQSLNYEKINKFLSWSPEHTTRSVMPYIYEWYKKYFNK